MSSTPTARLRFQKQATGDNPNAWGDVLSAVLDIVDEATAGFVEISVNANVVLSVANYASDQARRSILRFTGTGGFSVTIPAVEKMYYIDNRCAADVTLKTAAGASASVLKGTKRIAYCDGTNVVTDTSAGAPSASDVAFNPTGTVGSTNVQSAIAEIDGDVSNRIRYDAAQGLTSAQQLQARLNIGTDAPTISALGADQADFTASNANVILASVSFVAMRPSLFVIASVSINHQAAGSLFGAAITLFNSGTGASVYAAPGVTTYFSNSTIPAGEMIAALSFTGLAIGTTYTLQFLGNRGSTNAPSSISKPAIQGAQL